MNTLNVMHWLYKYLLKENISMFNITTGTVKGIVSILKISKTSRPDGIIINPKILNNAVSCIVPSLTKLLNFPLRTCTFAASWKMVK